MCVLVHVSLGFNLAFAAIFDADPVHRASQLPGSGYFDSKLNVARCTHVQVPSHVLTRSLTQTQVSWRVYPLISDQLVEGKQTVVSKQGAVSQFRFAFRPSGRVP